MATWVNEQTTSSGGNISLVVSGGYGTVTRSGDKISFYYGVRFKQSTTTYTYNSICARPGGTNYYAQKSSGSTHTAANTWYYATSTSNSVAQYKTETVPFYYETTVSGAGGGSVTVTVGTAWNGFTPTANKYNYSFSVPYPARCAASMSTGTSTESQIPISWSDAQGLNCTAYCYYRVNGSGSSYSSVTMATSGSSGSYTLGGLAANTTYEMYTTLVPDGDWNRANSTGSTTKATLALPSFSSISKSYLPISSNSTESLTFNFSNPNSVSIQCYIKNASESGTQFGSNTTSTTSCSVGASCSTMRSSIGTGLTGTYYCYAIATLKDGSTRNLGAKTGTYFTCNITSVTANDDCTLTLAWSSGVSATSLKYSLDSGSTWTAQSGTGTSGSFKISQGTGAGQVTGGQTYNLKLTSITGQGTAISGTPVSATTKDWPYISAINANTMTIGETSQTLTIMNPSGYGVKLYATLSNNKDVIFTESTTSTSYTITQSSNVTYNGGTTTFANALYNSIPSTISGTIVFKCVYGDHYLSEKNKSATYSINTTNCKPTMGSTFSYVDAKSATVTIMGDSGATLIQKNNQLNTTFNGATAASGASISKYKVSIGSTSIEKTTSGTYTVGSNLNFSANTEMKLQVTDSRGLVNDKSIMVKFVPYDSPTLAYSAERNNNYDTSGTLKLTPNLSALKNSSNVSKNSVVSLTYKYYNSTNFTRLTDVTSKPSSIATGKIVFCTGDNKWYKWSGSAVVEAGAEDAKYEAVTEATSGTQKTVNLANLNSACEYQFEIYISDRLGNNTYITSIGKGQPIMFVDANNLGVGIDRFPNGDGLYVQKIHLGNNAYLYYNETNNSIEFHFD